MRELLTFDDVLIQPGYSDISSRNNNELDTSINLVEGINLDLPIIAANMDTICEQQMCIAMEEQGGLGICHRFLDFDAHNAQICDLKNRIACVGVGNKELDRANYLFGISCAQAFLIDIAHAHCKAVKTTLNELKLFEIPIIVGNVATAEAAAWLCDLGADCIKIGIGPGSVCTTRVQTGVGIPQFSAIQEISEAVYYKYGSSVSIIADGGCRTAGDVCKALAAGADAVMLGGMLAGCDETPNVGEPSMYKIFRGMASQGAQESWKGEAKHVEGEELRISCKGPVKNVIDDIRAGLRSCMSYVSARSIKELQENSQFVKISKSAQLEGEAHATKR